MPVIGSGEAELAGVLKVAELMAVAARTAPKARGVDTIKVAVVHGPELEEIAAEMEKVFEETGLHFFKRDADCIRRSLALVLVGAVGSRPRGLNCGACGFPTCEEFEKARASSDLLGPNCVMAMLDLGIAVGSAVKVAADLNVDNRIMYTVGVAARRLRLLEADMILGIPLSATGKNIYFDRKV